MSRSRVFLTRHRGDEGAAAVEFGLVLPILLVIAVGIVEFGLALNAQVSLSGAAREGARVMALYDDPDAARSATIGGAPTLNPQLTPGDIAISPGSCSPGQPVTVTATYPFEFITSFFTPTVTLTGEGVMRCGG